MSIYGMLLVVVIVGVLIACIAVSDAKVRRKRDAEIDASNRHLRAEYERLLPELEPGEYLVYSGGRYVRCRTAYCPPELLAAANAWHKQQAENESAVPPKERID